MLKYWMKFAGMCMCMHTCETYTYIPAERYPRGFLLIAYWAYLAIVWHLLISDLHLKQLHENVAATYLGLEPLGCLQKPSIW